MSVKGTLGALVVPATILLASVLSVFPWPQITQWLMAMPFAATYYWSVRAPQMLPIAAVFFIGIFHDLLTHSPPGIHVLMLMTARLAVAGPQGGLLRQSPLVAWCGFTLLALVGGLMQWFFGWVILENRGLWLDIAITYAVVVLGYPILSALLSTIVVARYEDG